MTDKDLRDLLENHWAASNTNAFEAEHRVYRADAVLEYPQSGCPRTSSPRRLRQVGKRTGLIG